MARQPAVRRCAPSPIEPEQSLCGDAPEAYAIGLAPEPFELAGTRSSPARAAVRRSAR